LGAEADVSKSESAACYHQTFNPAAAAITAYKAGEIVVRVERSWCIDIIMNGIPSRPN
jgi:hypothetical protein